MALKIPASPRYRKRVGAFSGADVKHDESVIGFSTAARIYNFDFSSGALRDGYGIGAHERVPIYTKRYCVYRYYSEDAGRYIDQYVFQSKSGLFWYYDELRAEIRLISGIAYPPFEAMNYRINGRDVLLITCEGYPLITWDGKILQINESTPQISSMALHYERLFVTSKTEPTKLFFSADFDPLNWSTSGNRGGYIELLDDRGEMNKVVSFADYLYVFRDHGISRITAYADVKEFAVSNLFVAAGRIFPETIQKCGSVIVFLASDGLYAFDGYECRKVLTQLDGLIKEGVASAFYDGKYYLSCKADFGDGKKIECENTEYKANMLLVFDPLTGEYSVSRGMDIRFMSACTFLGEDFLAACDEEKGGGVIVRNGKRFDTPLEKRWESPLSDFGMPDKYKAVREVHVDTETDISVSVLGDGKERAVAVKPGVRRIRYNIRARQLSLSVQTNTCDCRIKPPTVVYSL